MEREIPEISVEKSLKPETALELTALYNAFVARLRECADFRSDGNKAEDLAVETMEDELHALQDDVVKSASKITLRSKQDIKDILDFWHVVRVQNAPDEVSLSDRIIMNIRDYYDEAVLKA